jgi:hypothetical protein
MIDTGLKESKKCWSDQKGESESQNNALAYGSYTYGTLYSLNKDTMLSSPLLSGVSSFNGGASSFHVPSLLNPNSVCVAYWTDGYCLVAYRTDKYVLPLYLSLSPLPR